jgi:DNA-binding PadR family transcriptional regulator
MPRAPKRWLHPQAVPRGFLRLYILTRLSHGPETGYSIMQRIDETTEGAWRPGPGTMYPMLKGLVADGLVKVSGRQGHKTYTITDKGRRALALMRDGMATMGRKERVLSRLFSDILSPTEMVQIMVGRYREGNELFRKVVQEVPRPERDAHLRDMKLLMEAQTRWIDLQLQTGGRPAPRPAARSRR